jgi:ribosomal-protein-alanine N-acetyltransferase
MKTITLRKSTESDLDALFIIQLNKEANYLAAFTSRDSSDRTAYFEKWEKLLADPTINMRTILQNDTIAGSVSKYEMDGKAEITYWIGREFWGQGIATSALQKLLAIEPMRPMNARVAFDNIGSQRVLEKCGFIKTGADRGFANARGKEIEEFIYILE